MMQFRSCLAAACLLALGACNPWFDYAPREVIPNVKADPKRSGMDASPATCPAKDLQYLVGQSRSVLETMRFGTEVRVEEALQIHTLEYIASRTRILIGRDDKIRAVICG
jgi:hypothetical protein